MNKSQEHINRAFAEINARMISSDQEWAKSKTEGLKNTMAKIAKRDAQIIDALEKAGINEIPEFTLSQSHRSNGVEGSFDVDDHTVTIMVDQFKIRTILAGGHSTPRLHARTFVKIT